jgi:hypothetical protein
MTDARRYKPGSKERGAVAERNEEEERARLSVIQVEVLLEGRQKRSEDDSGEKVEEEDQGEENQGAHLAAKGGGRVLLTLASLAGYANRGQGFSSQRAWDEAARSIPRRIDVTF